MKGGQQLLFALVGLCLCVVWSNRGVFGQTTSGTLALTNSSCNVVPLTGNWTITFPITMSWCNSMSFSCVYDICRCWLHSYDQDSCIDNKSLAVFLRECQANRAATLRTTADILISIDQCQGQAEYLEHEIAELKKQIKIEQQELDKCYEELIRCHQFGNPLASFARKAGDKKTLTKRSTILGDLLSTIPPLNGTDGDYIAATTACCRGLAQQEAANDKLEATLQQCYEFGTAQSVSTLETNKRVLIDALSQVQNQVEYCRTGVNNCFHSGPVQKVNVAAGRRETIAAPK